MCVLFVVVIFLTRMPQPTCAHIYIYIHLLIYYTQTQSTIQAPVVGSTHSTRGNCVIMTYHMVHSIQNHDNRVDNCFISFLEFHILCAFYIINAPLVGRHFKEDCIINEYIAIAIQQQQKRNIAVVVVVIASSFSPSICLLCALC